MGDSWAVIVEGLTDLKSFDGADRRIRLAAARAINKVTRDGRVDAARDIRQQVNFPASYVSPGQKRLYVSEQATADKLQGKITARARSTSLARFVQGNPTHGHGVSIEVTPGKVRFMRRAFLIKLPQGRADVDTKYNLGLAIRLRAGETIRNKAEVRRLDKGLYLLYGPSVDQVFRARDGSGVASDLAPSLVDDLSDEFLRLLEVFG
jgi:hypothetical protein